MPSFSDLFRSMESHLAVRDERANDPSLTIRVLLDEAEREKCPEKGEATYAEILVAQERRAAALAMMRPDIARSLARSRKIPLVFLALEVHEHQAHMVAHADREVWEVTHKGLNALGAAVARSRAAARAIWGDRAALLLRDPEGRTVLHRLASHHPDLAAKVLRDEPDLACLEDAYGITPEMAIEGVEPGPMDKVTRLVRRGTAR